MPASARASSWSNGRSQICRRPPESTASKASVRPSGESDGGPTLDEATRARDREADERGRLRRAARPGDREAGGGERREPRTPPTRGAPATRRLASTTPAARRASRPRRSSAAAAITSWALCQRSSGSFSRHFRMTWSSAGGVIGWMLEIGGGCDDTIAAIRLVRALAHRRPAGPSPSRRAPRRARRCRCARRRPAPRAARAPCTGTCRGSCPAPVSGLSTRCAALESAAPTPLAASPVLREAEVEELGARPS